MKAPLGMWRAVPQYRNVRQHAAIAHRPRVTAVVSARSPHPRCSALASGNQADTAAKNPGYGPDVAHPHATDASRR